MSKVKIGRPRKFESNDELIECIEKYFDGKDDGMVTITGLAFALGFTDRRSFYDYEKNSEFSHTIKRARFAIACSYEESLREGKNTAGNIFGLKNIDGWADKQEIEQTIDSTVVNTDVDLTKLGKEDLDTMKELIKKAAKDEDD